MKLRHPTLSIVLTLIACSFAMAKTKGLPPLPGQVLSQPQAWTIILEDKRSLFWPKQGPVLLQAGGKTLFRINLQSTGRKSSSREALGLELTESDLGGVGSSKVYLKGKQAPKGRTLDPKQLTKAPVAPKLAPPSTMVSHAGVSSQKNPDGSKLLKFVWLDGIHEEVFFDRRDNFVSSTQIRQLGEITYRLEQWLEGSFRRHYQSSQGSIDYVFDAGDRSYRLAFFNSRAEVVAEVSCRKTCRREE